MKESAVFLEKVTVEVSLETRVVFFLVSEGKKGVRLLRAL